MKLTLILILSLSYAFSCDKIFQSGNVLQEYNQKLYDQINASKPKFDWNKITLENAKLEFDKELLKLKNSDLEYDHEHPFYSWDVSQFNTNLEQMIKNRSAYSKGE